MKRNRIIAVGMIVVMMTGLMGCGSHKSLEEQVTENLLKVEKIPESEMRVNELAPVPEDKKVDNKEIEEAVEKAAEEIAEAAGLDEPKSEDKMEETPAETVEPAETEEADKEGVAEDDNRLQIVFLGDSIFDNARDGTGVPYLTGVGCNANIYNLAIGGSPAALYKDEDARYENWVSIGMLGMVNAICGHIDADKVFSNFYAKKVFDTCDFSKTDYFVINYGTNDFLSRIPITNDAETEYDPYSYYGAVKMGVSELLNKFPDATVIFVTPHYEQFYGKDGLWMGDCNTVNLGQGVLSDYIAAGYNAAMAGDAIAINAYKDMGIDAYTAEDMLEDGIHLTEDGRKAFAEVLSRRINKMELEKAN